MMLDTFALVALERAIDGLLARDPATPARLSTLAGKTLRVTLDEPRLALRMAFHAEGVTLARVHDWHDRDDLEITLTQRARERLIAGDRLEQLLFGGQLPTTGETALLPTIQSLFTDLDLDWEGALAKGLGNGTAHGIASGLDHLSRQARFLAREWRSDLRDYLLEERRWITGRDQLEVARDHLTELQQTIDRLGARIVRLQRNLGSRS